jgi:hypothetical protein
MSTREQQIEELIRNALQTGHAGSARRAQLYNYIENGSLTEEQEECLEALACSMGDDANALSLRGYLSARRGDAVASGNFYGRALSSANSPTSAQLLGQHGFLGDATRTSAPTAASLAEAPESLRDSEAERLLSAINLVLANDRWKWFTDNPLEIIETLSACLKEDAAPEEKLGALKEIMRQYNTQAAGDSFIETMLGNFFRIVLSDAPKPESFLAFQEFFTAAAEENLGIAIDDEVGVEEIGAALEDALLYTSMSSRGR